ncbi:MAG: cob(I)alamin adenosyltransferase [Glaciecola sp.]
MTSQDAPIDDPIRPDGRQAKSVVLVLTGDGKGKSSSAFGTAVRGLARGWKIAVIQFLKSGEWRVGEEAVLTKLGADWFALGDGFTWESKDLDESAAIAQRAWAFAAEQIRAGEHHIVLLDEITYAINYGWIDGDEVAAVIRDRPEHVYVVATGRDAPQVLIDVADTVSEVRNVKHAYDKGIMARRGFDY